MNDPSCNWAAASLGDCHCSKCELWRMGRWMARHIKKSNKRKEQE